MLIKPMPIKPKRSKPMKLTRLTRPPKLPMKLRPTKLMRTKSTRLRFLKLPMPLMLTRLRTPKLLMPPRTRPMI